MLSKMEYQIDKTLQNKETKMLKRIQFCTHKKMAAKIVRFKQLCFLVVHV